MLTFESTTYCSFSISDVRTYAPKYSQLKLHLEHGVISNSQTDALRFRGLISSPSKKWTICSAAQTQTIVLGDEERKMWESCKQALSTFKFSDKEEDMILGKAFGQVHSPYWGEEREKEVPKVDLVNDILDYLRTLGLSDDDLCKLLKKFPEVLGCSVEDELRTNVRVLEEEWGIKGKSLRNLLLRNPRVLGYNVDCKGDCMAKCTRCWVRF
ncbi:PREDICTED: uncharacterized protein LOC104596778 [Nelumbo nucifera]|uniref:Uncharacterized protein LOC104596778 n=2 Tax=Nelumbo nucifera TaxID=4432 RepID=A0A1U7ZS90_NELNU|nr:PREDICTED: uncharacterized protein LOC104596778 [Nelumbo nucifera]XP_010256366.1 PREDICTED: uncharacterized protein LOC104596778 [Nelumbo nucifera]DAD39232.1 TPA_asm: hypothetical protein HUJ06_013555 [Nelumbo nucifera]